VGHSSFMIKVGINGAAGRMGLRLVSLISQQTDLKLTLALERPNHPDIGKDIALLAGFDKPSGVVLTDNIKSRTADIILDFSTPPATINCLEACKKYHMALLAGTTGLNNIQIDKIKKASRYIPCLVSPNLSWGANWLFELVGQTTHKIGEEAEIEIIEMHHATKKDSPSGTALRLKETITQINRNRPLRGKKKDIPIHSLRIGRVVGEHKVIFGLPGERIELTHRVDNRDAFAEGAIKTTRFLARAKPAFYTTKQVLGVI